MKRYAFILLVLLSAGAVRAQRYEKNILGVRAGVNVSTCAISIEDVRINTGSRAGFHFAVTDQILLHRCPSTSKRASAFRAAAAGPPLKSTATSTT